MILGSPLNTCIVVANHLEIATLPQNLCSTTPHTTSAQNYHRPTVDVSFTDSFTMHSEVTRAKVECT